MRVAVLLVVLGCQQAEPEPAPVAPPAPKPIAPTEHTPFLITNRLVGEAGNVIRELPGVWSYATAVPEGPHRFRLAAEYARGDDILVDAKTGSITSAPPPVRFDASDDTSVLTRTSPDGTARWTQTLTGYRTLRAPDFDIGGGVVVATIDQAIHAFDDVAGKPLWTVHAAGDRVHIVGSTVYSTTCDGSGHWLIGNSLGDGHELFRAPLSGKCDASALAFANNHVFAIGTEHTQIFDLGGQQLSQLDLTTFEIEATPHTILLESEKDLVALDNESHVLWRRPSLPHKTGYAFAELPDGDLMIAYYARFDDSGADVFRLTRTGAERWHSSVPHLDAPHSGYLQYIYIEVRDDQLFVISQATGGVFFERLSAVTGKRELRCEGFECTTP